MRELIRLFPDLAIHRNAPDEGYGGKMGFDECDESRVCGRVEEF